MQWLCEPAADLGTVLVQGRRWEPVLGRRVGEPDRIAHGRNPPDGDDGFEADLVGERDTLINGVDRPARDAHRDDVAKPLELGARTEAFGQQGPKFGAVGGAVLVAGEARIVGERGDAEHLDQLAELAVVADGDDQFAIGAGQGLVGEHAGVAVAHAERDDSPGDVRAALVDQPGQRRREQVDLDVLPVAALVPGVQRGEDADRGVHSGHHVEDGDARAERLAVGIAGQAHQPGDCLHHKVIPRQRRSLRPAAEAADRRVHHARIGGGHRVVVEPVAGQAARLEVLDEHVRAAGQLLRGRQVRRRP